MNNANPYQATPFPDNLYSAALFCAKIYNDEELIACLMDARSDINKRFEKMEGVGLLHIAAAKNYSNLASILIDAGADVNLFDRFVYNTPLMIAAYCGHSQITELLISSGAQINTKNNNHRVALMLAAHKNHVDCLRLLIKAGAQLDLRAKESGGHEGASVLSIAVYGGYTEILTAMLEAGADSEIRNSNGNTPLLLAISSLQIECIKTLLNHGANPNAINLNEITPLIRAAIHGYEEAVLLLLAHPNIDINLTHQGKTARDLAAERGFDNIVKRLDDYTPSASGLCL